MADIAMCKGEGCEKREKCYRYTAPVGDCQSVLSKPPIKDSGFCKWFWDNTGQIDGRKIGKWWRNENE